MAEYQNNYLASLPISNNTCILHLCSLLEELTNRLNSRVVRESSDEQRGCLDVSVALDWPTFVEIVGFEVVVTAFVVSSCIVAFDSLLDLQVPPFVLAA